LEIIVNQRTQELKQAMDNLTKQNQDLAQFSYIVSHNLRSPVARVLGLVGIFNESDYSDPYNKDIVAHLKKATTDLDTVIKDLTQIISVRNDLNKTKEKIFVLEIVQLEKFLLKDEIEKIKAIIQVIDLEDVVVFSIKSYVQSIIHNLISNAIKYRSPKRSPHIIIRATQDENSICISVQDNGLGMDLTEVDSYKIFGLYQRMHDHVEGKGMGLFLVKTQIESLGGKIEVDSKLDVGTTFRVYFPV
jgi:light-regulated signal transduction histidine kinase (bacteriophytochrome)